MSASQTRKTRKEGSDMKIDKIAFILGIIAGIGTYLAWAFQFKIALYVLAIAAIISLGISETARNNKITKS